MLVKIQPKRDNYLIKFLIKLVANDNDYVMDFFAGSGTTAQAVYEINKEHNKNLHYILIQLNETIDEKSEIHKNCLKYGIKANIPEILLLRINTYLKQNNKEIDYEIKNIK